MRAPALDIRQLCNAGVLTINLAYVLTIKLAAELINRVSQDGVSLTATGFIAISLQRFKSFT